MHKHFTLCMYPDRQVSGIIVSGRESTGIWASSVDILMCLNKGVPLWPLRYVTYTVHTEDSLHFCNHIFLTLLLYAFECPFRWYLYSKIISFPSKVSYFHCRTDRHKFTMSIYFLSTSWAQLKQFDHRVTLQFPIRL